MNEQEIKKQINQVQHQLTQTIVQMDSATPSVILIAACMNVVGIVADAGKLHQSTAGLLRDCADRLEEAASAATQAAVH